MSVFRLLGVAVVVAIAAASASARDESSAAQLTYIKWDKLSSRLCFARSDGSHRRALFGGAYDQDWSPDGRSVVFYRPGEGFVSANADGDIQSILVRTASRFDRPWHPRWSPTTDWIAITDGGGGGSTLVMYPAGGGTGRPIVHADFSSFGGPSWLRDGRHLAFSSEGGTLTPGVYTVALDGSELHLVLPGAVWPEVSPDGSRLAYLRLHGVERRGTLYVSNPDGSNERRLTRPGESVQQASWSPDGQTIAFVRARGNRFEIASVRIDGTREHTLLASNSASYAYPAFRPAGSPLAAAHRATC